MREDHGVEAVKLALGSCEFVRALLAACVFVSGYDLKHCGLRRFSQLTDVKDEMQGYVTDKLEEFIKQLYRHIDPSIREYLDTTLPDTKRWEEALTAAGKGHRIPQDLLREIKSTDPNTLDDAAYELYRENFKQVGTAVYSDLFEWKNDFFLLIQDLTGTCFSRNLTFNIDNL